MKVISLLLEQIRAWPCWADVQHKSSSSGLKIPVLDSLRGIAVMLVLADHTGVSAGGDGLHGVLIFFCLSGYLLTLPFTEGKVSYTLRGVWGYLQRRLWRILPMYLFYIAIAALFWKHDVGWFLRHLVFYQADFHLWSVRQELLFYMALPWILLPLFFLRGHPLVQCVLLLCLAGALSGGITDHVFQLTETQRHEKLFIFPFIQGMALAFGMKWLRLRTPFLLRQWQAVIMLCMLTLAPIAVSHFWREGLFSYWLGINYVLMIAVLQLLPKGIVQNVVQWSPLRALGVVGYSAYLLHYTVKDISGMAVLPYGIYFLKVLGVTYLLSCLTYCLIEKPAMLLGRRIQAADKRL